MDRYILVCIEEKEFDKRTQINYTVDAKDFRHAVQKFRDLYLEHDVHPTTLLIAIIQKDLYDQFPIVIGEKVEKAAS